MPTHVLIDYDAKYGWEYDVILVAEGIAAKRQGPLAPNLNAFAERFVQRVR
jgi:putative transposase